VTAGSRRRWPADLALAGLTLIWGATFVVVKQALESSSTLLFLALRFTLAGAALALLFRGPVRTAGKGAWRAGLVVGVPLFLGYLFQTLGLRLTTPAKSGFITGLSVVLVPVLGALVYREWPSWNCWAGVASATAGLYLLAMPAGSWGFERGDLLTLLCAVAFALHILLLGRFSRRVRAEALSVAQVVVAAGLALGTFWWAEEVFVRWSFPLVGAVVATGLLATALAFSVQTWAMQVTTATHTALIFSLEPVFAGLTSYLVLGETLSSRGLRGAALILAGIILAEVKPRGGQAHL